jgi:hypothetical protein
MKFKYNTAVARGEFWQEDSCLSVLIELNHNTKCSKRSVVLNDEVQI